jgi:DNA repair protein RecO (recombination protein O)
MAGFYLNELVMRLLPRQDPHPSLYDAYEQALQALSTVEEGSSRLGLTEAVLRQFECRLLREMGVAPEFSPDRVRVSPDQRFWVSPHDGVYPSDQAVRSEDALEVTGYTLLALSRYDHDLASFSEGFAQPELAHQAKRLLRGLIRHQLGGEDLASREAVRALAQMRSRS